MDTSLDPIARCVGHDPARESDRTPLGAVPAGTSVEMALNVLGDARTRVHRVELEVAGAAWVLTGAGTSGAQVHTLWAAEKPGVSMGSPLAGVSAACPTRVAGRIDTAGEPRVLLYRFWVELADGTRAVCVPDPAGRATGSWLHSAGHAAARDPLPWFRLTVYTPDFCTPAWMHGAIMYQVFPDRFAPGDPARTAAGIRAHEQAGRPVRLHTNWDEPADWEGGDLPLDHPDAYDPADFFGGTLAGIEGRLPYLAELGVGALYLNPVFEARSNHRYDTASYERIDPLLGTAEDFERLCARAEELGIRVVLDAVLSHTGASSVYFDGPQGALTGEASPYRSWYDFEHPCAFAPYRCWWGHKSLPEVDERDPGWQRYMFGEKGGSETTAFGSAATSAIDDAATPAHAKAPEAAAGILPAWLARGAAGYRLDVADELPDDVLARVRTCVKAARPDACVIGEVWEDPCLKVSYGELRTYGLGGSLDTVMNYALRDALLGFALGRLDAYQLAAVLKSQRLNYPAPLYGSLMNLLGSHDVERLRSVLALGRELKGCSRAEQATLVAAITPEQDARGAELQTMLATFVYGLPGMPCVYYGDELGMQGGADPFNRQTFPCNCTARRDCGADLTGLYRKLGAMRRSSPALRGDAAGFVALDSDVLVALRPPIDGDPGALVAINRGEKPWEGLVDLLADGSGLTGEEQAALAAVGPSPGLAALRVPGRSTTVTQVKGDPRPGGYASC